MKWSGWPDSNRRHRSGAPGRSHYATPAWHPRQELNPHFTVRSRVSSPLNDRDSNGAADLGTSRPRVCQRAGSRGWSRTSRPRFWRPHQYRYLTAKQFGLSDESRTRLPRFTAACLIRSATPNIEHCFSWNCGRENRTLRRELMRLTRAPARRPHYGQEGPALCWGGLKLRSGLA